MEEFKLIEGPQSIPVFYQRMPDIIKSSAMNLCVFTGGSDDLTIGERGIHHWFEHVPFRGTKSFPYGYLATKGPVTSVGGRIGAYVQMHSTCFHTHLPTRYLSIGAKHISSLVGDPLLREEDISDEREIILEEIRNRKSDCNGYSWYNLNSILWPNHPMGGHVLGSEDSLRSMDVEQLRNAHELHYGCERMVLFVSTAMVEKELRQLLQEAFCNLRKTPGQERRTAASYGTLTWEPGVVTKLHTKFDTAIVKVLYWLPTTEDERENVARYLARRVLDHGSSGSPLYHAVREKQPLCYSAGVTVDNTKDGGYHGFHVNTSNDKVTRVEQALAELLLDKRVRSVEWFNSLKNALMCDIEMNIPNPLSGVRTAAHETAVFGKPSSSHDFQKLLLEVEHEEVTGILDQMCEEEPRKIIAYSGE